MADITKTIKVAVDDKELRRLQQEFKAVERSYAKMSEMVAREQMRMLTQQEKETAALQSYLGKMEQRAQKEADVQSRIFTARQKNMQLAEQMSQKEIELSNAFGNSQRGASNVAHAMMNLNYVVRDSPYFFQNFALGVLAVGNNLNPLIDSMIRASKESKLLGKSLGSELLGFLKGPGGVIFAMSLLVTAFQAVTFAMSKGKKESDDFTESLEKQKNQISSLREEWNRFEEDRKRNEKFKDETSLNRLGDLRLSQKSIQSQISANLRLLGTEGLDDKERFRLSSRVGELRIELEGVNDEIRFINYGWQKYVGDIKEARDVTKELKKEFGGMIDTLRTGLPNRASRAGFSGWYRFGVLGDRAGNTGKPSGMGGMASGAGSLGDEKELAKALEMFEGFSKSTADVFHDNMMTAWEKIFGEANSLFEQLIMAWTSELAKMFAMDLGKSLVTGLFDFFAPGLGTALGAVAGSPASQGGGNYYIVVDGDVVMPAVVKRLPGAVGRLQRLGKM